jgi:Protein of unknown function (DUF3466)
VVDLGAGSRAYAVNERGLVAGSIVDARGVQRPAIFRRGRAWVVLNDVEGYFRRINDNGEAVGHSPHPVNDGFHWKDGVTTMFQDVTILDINDASVMVGVFGVDAVKIDNGVVVPLGNWGAPLGTSATAIDAAGIIYGTRNFGLTGDSVRVALDGTVQSLSPPLPAEGKVSATTVSNKNGNVAGFWYDNNAFVSGFAVVAGQYHRIDGPSARSTIASGINDQGAVVGSYLVGTDIGILRAFLWRDTVTDLSSLPEVAAAGWLKLTEALAINNRGVIVGYGEQVNFQPRGFMLIPRRR